MRLAMGLAVALAGADDRLLFEQPEELTRRLAWWRARGVEGVVLYDNLPDFYRTPPERFVGVAAAIRAAGLEVAGFNGLRKSLFMPELLATDRQRCDHILAVCRVLRPAIVDLSLNVPLPQGLDPHRLAARPLFRGEHASDETYRVAAAELRPFVRACAAFGADFSIELHDDGLQDTAEGCLKLLRLLDEPNAGVNPDIGNWYRVAHEPRGTWREQLAQLAPRTNYWEVKNYRRVVAPEAGRAFAWNTDLDGGDLDFREATVTLWRAGFRGWVCNEGGNGDRVRSTLRYVEYLRWVLDEWIPAMEPAGTGD